MLGLKIDNTDASSAWSILEKDNNMFTIFQDVVGYHRINYRLLRNWYWHNNSFN